VTLPSDIYADLRRSVVRISAGETYGSGWAIEEGWIITNAHVVAGNSTVTVEVPLANGGVTLDGDAFGTAMSGVVFWGVLAGLINSVESKVSAY